MKRLLFSLLFATSVIGANAQLKTPALSPTCKVSQDFSLSSIDITYSRPSMRGRKIVGDVVPYGKAWRTGANAPTKIKTGEELIIAGQKVKAGEYELYTIPGKESWEVVLNTGAGPWTADGFAKENDVARFNIKPMAMEKEVQTFTIEVSDITFTTCKINLMWERTKIVLPVEANNGDNVEANIQKAINHPSIPYFQAASYYYESDKKMDLAKEYVDKALEQDPKAFYMWYLKARIERKLGNNDAAIAAARKSMETAQGAPLENEYQRNNQKIIDDINHTSRHKQDADK